MADIEGDPITRPPCQIASFAALRPMKTPEFQNWRNKLRPGPGVEDRTNSLRGFYIDIVVQTALNIIKNQRPADFVAPFATALPILNRGLSEEAYDLQAQIIESTTQVVAFGWLNNHQSKFAPDIAVNMLDAPFYKHAGFVLEMFEASDPSARLRR